MKYSWDRYDYEEVFDDPFQETREEQIERLRDNRICGYRTKTIRAGNMLECEIYPIYKKRVGLSRAPRRRETPSRQQKQNDRNARKRFVRLINANFTKEDIWVTMTYAPERMPSSADEADEDVRRYVRRLEYYVKSRGFPPLKYAYVTEYNDDDQDRIRVHHHVITNLHDRDLAEEKWDGGARTQSRRLQPDDDFELSGLAFYLMKDPRGRKRWKTSKNLKKPKETVSDGKITKSAALKIAKEGFCARDKFEKLYPDFDFRDIQTYISDQFAGVYLYVRMRRRNLKNKNAKGGNFMKRTRRRQP